MKHFIKLIFFVIIFPLLCPLTNAQSKKEQIEYLQNKVDSLKGVVFQYKKSSLHFSEVADSVISRNSDLHGEIEKLMRDKKSLLITSSDQEKLLKEQKKSIDNLILENKEIKINQLSLERDLNSIKNESSNQLDYSNRTNSLLQINASLMDVNELIMELTLRIQDKINNATSSKNSINIVEYQKCVALLKEQTKNTIEYIELFKAHSAASTFGKNSTGEGFEKFLIHAHDDPRGYLCCPNSYFFIFPSEISPSNLNDINNKESNFLELLLFGDSNDSPSTTPYSYYDLIRVINQYKSKLNSIVNGSDGHYFNIKPMPYDLILTIQNDEFIFKSPSSYKIYGIDENYYFKNIPLTELIVNLTNYETRILDAQLRIFRCIAQEILTD